MNHAAAATLPLDIRLMTLTTSAMGWVLVVAALAAAGWWAVRHPVWALSAIEIRGEVQHQNTMTIRAHVAQRLQGSFITLDLGEVQKAFESVPWVRQAVVQRVFPNRLRVTLQEHQPVAWWGEAKGSRLVNRQGEVFETSLEDDDTDGLPELVGPSGHAAQVMAVYQRLQPVLTRLEQDMRRLELTAQGSWLLVLESGATLQLGRGSPDDIEARLLRFAATLNQVASRYGRNLESADLRYPTAYAVRLHGVTTGDTRPLRNPSSR